MKKLIFTILWLGCMLCSVGCSEKELTEEERIENELQASEQYEQLLEGLSKETEANVEEYVCPEYYGGAYINGDGNLVVCVTELYDAESNKMEEYTGNEDVILQRVEYSYNTLWQENERIGVLYEAMWKEYQDVENMNSDPQTEDLLTSLRGSGINIKNNCLTVSIGDITDEKIKTFREIISDKEFIEFEEGGHYGWTP